MDRRAFIGALAGAILAAPLIAEAQTAETVYRVGVLNGGTAAGFDPLNSYADKLREFGYIEGQNLIVERRYANDKHDDLPRLVAELLRTRVDLIVTVGRPAASAAKQATATIPIVFFLATDPVAAGLVASMARPGGNLTGFVEGFYTDKQIEILREAVPRLSRVAFLQDSNLPPIAPSRFDPLQRVGVRVKILNVNAPKDFDGAFVAASKASVRGLVVQNSLMFISHFSRIASLAVRFRLPAIGHSPQFAQLGGFLAYGSVPGQTNFGLLMDKILKGVRPGDLPVEQPRKFQLVINLKTAKALGLTIPQSLLLRADQVIE